MPSPARILTAPLALVDRAVRPLVRRGLLRIPVVGGGVVLLKVTGRRSGKLREVPLLAARVGGRIVVSTVRSGSAWARNLRAEAEPEVVVNGRRRRADATVAGDGPTVAILSLED